MTDDWNVVELTPKEVKEDKYPSTPQPKTSKKKKRNRKPLAKLVIPDDNKIEVKEDIGTLNHRKSYDPLRSCIELPNPQPIKEPENTAIQNPKPIVVENNIPPTPEEVQIYVDKRLQRALDIVDKRDKINRVNKKAEEKRIENEKPVVKPPLCPAKQARKVFNQPPPRLPDRFETVSVPANKIETINVQTEADRIHAKIERRKNRRKPNFMNSIENNSEDVKEIPNVINPIKKPQRPNRAVQLKREKLENKE